MNRRNSDHAEHSWIGGRVRAVPVASQRDAIGIRSEPQVGAIGANGRVADLSSGARSVKLSLGVGGPPKERTACPGTHLVGIIVTGTGLPGQFEVVEHRGVHRIGIRQTKIELEVKEAHVHVGKEKLVPGVALAGGGASGDGKRA